MLITTKKVSDTIIRVNIIRDELVQVYHVTNGNADWVSYLDSTFEFNGKKFAVDGMGTRNEKQMAAAVAANL